MDEPLNLNDFKKLEDTLKDCLEEDRKYWVVNMVKCDAVTTAKSYEEFSDRVAAAHLRPLEKLDHLKAGSCKTVWNKYAEKEKIKK